MIGRIPFVLREALTIIRRKPLTSIMTALTVAMALGLGMTLGFLYLKAQLSLAGLRSHLVVEAFLDPAASNEQLQQFAKQSVATMPEVKSVQTVTKEEALTEYRRSTGEDASAVLGFNPLPGSIRITLKTPSGANVSVVEQKLKKFSIIKEVTFDSQALTTLQSRSSGLTLLAFILAGLLLAATIAFLFNSTRLAIHTRQNAIRTMHLLGARRTTIEMPFILEGTIAGCLGGLIGGATFLLMVANVLPRISPEFASTHSIGELAPYALLVPFVFGLLLGTIASALSTLTATRSLSLRFS